MACTAEHQMMSAVEVQQSYYEVVGELDWELYKKKDRIYLLQKIAIALCGPPTEEGDLLNGHHLEPKLQGYKKREEEITQKVYNKICEQAKYSQNGENIIISILRVVGVIPKTPEPMLLPTPSDYWVNLHTKKDDVDICIFHVFALRKCVSMKVKGCRIFIDHDARVYQNWDAYLKNNNLPKCVMVVPQNGEYKGELPQNSANGNLIEMPLVKCSVVPSPALGLGARVLNIADTASSVASVGVVLGVGAGLMIPVIAPAALTSATVVGAATGIYGIVRSSISLADRINHEQSVGLADSEARASWISILVSTVGISANGASKLLSWAASTGTNVEILMNAVRVLQYTSIGTGFIGVVNSLGEMIYKFATYNETPNKTEIFQFTTSLLFAGLGVMSNQTAQDIVQDAQARSINEIRDALSSKAKRNMFDKVTAETRRVKGSIRGNSDVIKGLKTIKDKDDFFGKLANINKQMNKNKVRVSLAPDGNPLINNQHKVNLQDLRGLTKSGRDQLFVKYGPAQNLTKNVPTRVYASNCSTQGNFDLSEEIQFQIKTEDILKITNFLQVLSKVDQEFIFDFISEFSAASYNTILHICVEMIAFFVPSELDFLLAMDKDYKVRLVLFVVNYIKSNIHVDESDDLNFVNELKKFIKYGRIDKSTLLKMKNKFMQKAYECKYNYDPSYFDDMHINRKKSKAQSKVNLISANDTVSIGKHEILVKVSTVEKLEEWFEIFTQQQCDLFMIICFSVISSLSEDELNEICEIDFDEDIIMRVGFFIINVSEYVIDYLLNDCTDIDILTDLSLTIKKELLEWRFCQEVREYETCQHCSGISFIL